jgi:hypothetical protein
VRLVELTTGDFFLRWSVRHPELPSAQELLGENGYYGDVKREKRLAYRKLYDVLPSKRREMPLPEQQGFALLGGLQSARRRIRGKSRGALGLRRALDSPCYLCRTCRAQRNHIGRARYRTDQPVSLSLFRKE